MSERTQSKNLDRPDTSWPSPMPTDVQLQGEFIRLLGAASSEDSEARLEHVTTRLLSPEVLRAVTAKLHTRLSVMTEFNRLSLPGHEVGRRWYSDEDVLLIRHMGIDRYPDLEKEVAPIILNLLLSGANSDGNAQERLDTIARTIGLVIAEAQAFSDANTRIARAVHDYTRDGLDGLSMERVSDVTRNFNVPEGVEKLVMMQNVAQLVEHPLEWPIGQGVIGVTSRAEDRYAEAADLVRSFRPLAEGGIVERSREMDSRMSAYLPETSSDEGRFARWVLRQKEYGAAALAATFPDGVPTRKLTEGEAERLVATNLDLMKMRVLSLGTAMARGGVFMAIDSSSKTGEPQFVQHRWLPDKI